MAPDASLPVPEKDMDVTEDELMIFSYILEGVDKSIKKRLSYDLNRCIGCGACVEVCPTHSIELGPVVEIAQGQLEGTPAVLIDHETCAFCGLCAVVCPTDAIEIEVEPEGKVDWSQYPRLRPFGRVDTEKCHEDPGLEVCQQCVKARSENDVKVLYRLTHDKSCPHDALVLESPYEGHVKILKNLLYKCDPNGCKACVNICPTESFSIPQKADDILKFGKVAVDSEKCIHCGACALACPVNIIEVRREDIHFIDGETGRAWTVAWNKLLDHLLTEKEACLFCKDQELLPVVEDVEAGEVAGGEAGAGGTGATSLKDFTPPREKLEELDSLYRKVKEFLGKVKVRYQMERGNSKKVREFFERELGLEGGANA
ncbi:MAG: 4Fe-4S binding protein [Promethearchaeota archaeon]